MSNSDLNAARADLLAVLEAALQRVNGRSAVRQHLAGAGGAEPLTLVALGKAAQAMALGAVDALGGRVRGGLVISKPGHVDPGILGPLGLEWMEGGHPLPTAGSLRAGERLLALLREGGGGPWLFLISGGASSLVEVLTGGFGLADLQRVNRWLLGSGLAIEEMNLVRKALSVIKGGGLLRWVGPGSMRALAISDVPGDDPGVIGSGLLVPEPRLAQRVLALDLPGWLRAMVERGLGERSGLPDRGPAIEIVASLAVARTAAAAEAARRGYAVFSHQTFVEGDAQQRGVELARALKAGPVGLHLWGGETTVRLPERPGRGGRNQHLALAAAMVLSGDGRCLFLSAGTDGSDGPTQDAGALVDGSTIGRARDLGLDPAAALRAADAGSLLAATGDLLHTGPTGTNVMDLMLGLKLDAD